MSINPVNGSPPGAEGIGNIAGKLNPSGQDKTGGSFETLLDETIGKVSSLQKETEKAIAEISNGGGRNHGCHAKGRPLFSGDD